MSALDLIVNSESELDPINQSKPDKTLVAWVVDHANDWEDHRDSTYKTIWDEYERLWRMKWKPEDKTRNSERSRLINPALQQAIESTVAELDEATFGKGKFWFDVEESVDAQTKNDILPIRDQLREDMERLHVPTEISKTFLYGAIFGTGIGKVLVNTGHKKKMVAQAVQGVMDVRHIPSVSMEKTVDILLEAIDPRHFVIDPAARTIDEALGCAHVIAKPTHLVREKQMKGIYNNVKLGSYDGVENLLNNDEGVDKNAEYTKITEYHGLIPTELLDEINNTGDDEQESLDDALLDVSEEEKAEFNEDDLTEAIVTIANDSVLLRAIANPHVMQDRGFISYQHDMVPNSFWGRGVAEKGYNPQKALDAALRARIDAMALITQPMMAADSTKLPRGQKLGIRPGKMFLTTGNPSETFMPFKFGGLDPNSFAQTSDLERMIQVGTGAIDTAAPLAMNARNSTASGMSMMTASALKRQRRAKQNIDRQFLNVLIEKVLWRYIQYDPERYPVKDYKFVVKSSMGLMAREYEQANLTQMLGIIQKDSPAFNVILRGIINNSSLEEKGTILTALEQQQQPDPQQQQIQQILEQLKLQNMKLTNDKLASEAQQKMAQAVYYSNKNSTESENALTNRITALTNATKEKLNVSTK